ncbi:hypothetical protein [Muriicola sp. Z0-33]|uniref:hypothetical protein n=1 Tax=Muriicola sp. Z0-33 TaxID=2816957 RepID=UPI0022381F18|nr:hypothetical protein [Muriicola sp. Z0-33]MCW5515760.1 hypothetical protein [Muriicola sp. Z0-33]
MEKYKYIEWFDAAEMHEHSKDWFSELTFIKDEQLFLNNLIQSFAVKAIDKEAFGQVRDFKLALSENNRSLLALFKMVQKHMNQLEIMIDDVDQLEMEKAYRITHKELFAKVNDYLLEYRTIKEKGFERLSAILKANKKLSLGNPDYKLRTTKT